MINNLIVDVSFPDDIFMINIKVEALQGDIYQLSYEADRQFIGLLELDKQLSACKLTGKVSLSESSLSCFTKQSLQKRGQSKKKRFPGSGRW